MTVGGQGLPRLQELAYLETIVVAAADGLTFEGVRLALVDHIWSLRAMSPGEPPNPADYRSWRGDKKKFVRNVTDALKELMRLGFLESSMLPSSGRSAYAHEDVVYQLTPGGLDWVTQLRTDRRAAFDGLIPRLIDAHRGFRCFLATVGAVAGDTTPLVIPLLRWSALPRNQRSEAAYRAAIGDYVAPALASSDLGWRAEPAEIREAVGRYVDRILVRAQARDKNPFPTQRAFTQTCEEALVRLAFAKAGCSIDYVSVEIARRWSRWLGLASYSYHVPGPYALRFWGTASIRQSAEETAIDRRAGAAWRERALEALNEHCQQKRASGTTYVPVWEARAAICWKLRIVDDEFDRAVRDMVAGRLGQNLSWRVHLDQVSVGTVPSSSAPLVFTTQAGGTRTYNVITVVPKRVR